MRVLGLSREVLLRQFCRRDIFCFTELEGGLFQTDEDDGEKREKQTRGRWYINPYDVYQTLVFRPPPPPPPPNPPPPHRRLELTMQQSLWHCDVPKRGDLYPDRSFQDVWWPRLNVFPHDAFPFTRKGLQFLSCSQK